MRKIPVSFGLLTFLDEIEYTEAALSADPDAEHLKQPFQEALEEWEALFAKERAARRAVTRAEAVVAIGNERLDALTTRFGATVRAFSPQLLGKLFIGTTPGQFIRRGLRAQCEKTRDVILPELGKLDAKDPLSPFVPELKERSSKALAALDARAAAKGARQVNANETDEWKEGINALRTTTYAELLKIATEKKYPKSWVESFFRQAEAKAGTEEEAEPPAGEEAGTG